MLLVTLALKTLLSISQNGINTITLNKQLGNHFNMDIINASIYLSSFPFSGCFQCLINGSFTCESDFAVGKFALKKAKQVVFLMCGLN